MKDKGRINIPSGTQYLSEVMAYLPVNSLFNKGIVGAGGTTIALTNDKPYVIAVPYISLIENKTSQLNNVLGVTGTTTSSEIKAYLKQTGVPKIMVTYDSIIKLVESITPSDFAILIDEYHLLFTQYSFRREAAIKVLNNYTKFKEYCFMTATELEDDFILDELKDTPRVVAEWDDVKEVLVNSIKCTNSVNHTVTTLINNFISGTIEGNAYIFVNSVEFIKEMVKVCNLNNDNTRAIWSKNNKKAVGLERGSSIDKPKKINLLTSTVFEGADFYDEDAKIYIVSDNREAHTLLDISTSFKQIAGRVRNTKYWNQINHIYTATRYNKNLTYDEYKSHCIKAFEQDKESVNSYNTKLTDAERAGIEPRTNDSYIVKVNNIFEFDANRVKIDLYNFKITKSLYSLRINVSNELRENGFIVIEHTSNIKNEVIVIEKGNTFKDTVRLLKQAESSTEYDILEVYYKETILHKIAFAKYPILEQILKDNELGFNFIEKHNYNLTNIKSRLIAKSDISEHNKILKLLINSGRLNSGNYISSDSAKKLMTDIYTNLGIKKTPKGTDINKYFETKPRTGKERGCIIIKAKSIFH